MPLAVIGIGANLGERMQNLNAAIAAVKALPSTQIEKTSHVYETEPWGGVAAPKYLNAVFSVSTEMSPHALLEACMEIEAALGRERGILYAPRTIDLDILLYEGASINTAELTLPHPRILERAFVMVPLLDLFPGGAALGLDFKPALEQADCSGVARYNV